MKKVAIVLFGTLILGFLAAAVILPREVYVERSLVINAPKEAIFPHIGDLHKWEGWSPWLAKDPEMKLTYSEDPAEGVGASYSWKSESQGNGTMTITKLAPPISFEGDLDFGDQGTAKASFFLEPQGDKTRVVWNMKADMGNNPIGKIFGLRMDAMVGPDFEDGLNRLKTLAEENPAPPAEPTPAATATPAPEATP